jgi:Fe(3+) dicitrate transport protein
MRNKIKTLLENPMSESVLLKPLKYQPLSAVICMLPLLTAGASTAMAQESNSPAMLPGLNVTADWLGPPTKASEKSYTGARTVVEKETLQDRGALNLEDALRPVPGLIVLDETGTGILPNIGVRGLNPLRSERLQILMDGYPIAIGPYSNVGVSLFPVTLPSLEVVDIVRGGASVHYGPNNVGGVVNFVTKPIPAQTSQTLRERITIAEETGNVLTDTYYRIGGPATDKLDLQFQANVQRGDGFRDHSDTEVDNLILDARYYLNDQHELASQLQYYRVDAELPGALTPKPMNRTAPRVSVRMMGTKPT